MRDSRWLSVLATATIVAATAAPAAQVKTAHPPDVDYSRYETYRWQERAELDAGHPLAEGSPMDRQIRAAGDRALAGAGLAVAGEGEPDLLVSYVGYVMDQLSIEGVRKEIGGGVAWIGDPASHGVMSYQEGTLVIEVRDAGSGKLVWSGWATDVATDAERLRKKAERAAFKILRNFPPKGSR
jgi:hypothetical protein